jgi:mRNA-degrading endonuclease RelE of RelBE toxin-antitoxin system
MLNDNKPSEYIIQYSPVALEHLQALTARQRSIVLDSVERMLTHHAAVETRNRRPMRPNPVAPWELRIGDLRVYYDVEDTPERVVYVLAVGIKLRDLVRFGKEVVRL